MPTLRRAFFLFLACRLLFTPCLNGCRDRMREPPVWRGDAAVETIDRTRFCSFPRAVGPRLAQSGTKTKNIILTYYIDVTSREAQTRKHRARPSAPWPSVCLRVGRVVEVIIRPRAQRRISSVMNRSRVRRAWPRLIDRLTATSKKRTTAGGSAVASAGRKWRAAER